MLVKAACALTGISENHRSTAIIVALRLAERSQSMCVQLTLVKVSSGVTTSNSAKDPEMARQAFRKACRCETLPWQANLTLTANGSVTLS